MHRPPFPRHDSSEKLADRFAGTDLGALARTIQRDLSGGPLSIVVTVPRPESDLTADTVELPAAVEIVHLPRAHSEAAIGIALRYPVAASEAPELVAHRGSATDAVFVRTAHYVPTDLALSSWTVRFTEPTRLAAE